MKKAIKIISVCLVLILLVTTLLACSPSVEEVTGTYSGSYTYNGNKFYVVIMLYNDGTYARATAKNGNLSTSEAGDYEIKGSKIRLYDSNTAHGSWIDYNYSSGVLETNGHKFTKE